MNSAFGMVLGGILLLVGVSSGVIVSTRLFPHKPLVCKIDPLYLEAMEQYTETLARVVTRIATILDAWEERQQHAMHEVERRRQQLQQDALRPRQPTGLDNLPTRMEKK